MYDINCLIEGAMKLDESEVDKRKVISILVDGIRNVSTEKCTYIKLYHEIYGTELIPELCKELVHSFNNDVEWTIEDTNSVATKLGYEFSKKSYTSYEFYAVMNLMYHNYNIPLRESGNKLDALDWGRMADYYFRDGEPDCKLVDYYFWYIDHK